MIVGAHVSSSGGIENSVARALDKGCNGLQLFTQSPRMWRPTNHKPANVAAFREAREAGGIEYAMAHAIYLINIASGDPDLWRKSTDALVQTMITQRAAARENKDWAAADRIRDAIGAAGIILEDAPDGTTHWSIDG